MRGWPAIRHSRSLIVVVALAVLGLPASSHAQTSCTSAPDAGDRAPAPHRWTAPLDLPLSLHASDLTLHDALDRVAAAAGVRLSYSTDLLPLDRSVCLSYDDAAVGDILATLLAGTTLEPVVAEGQFVVLAPRRAATGGTPAATRLHVNLLDRVVVTGTRVAMPTRPQAFETSVVTGRELVQRDASSLARALDAVVPGLWLWEQPPASFGARYGSLRGASSFGASAPKVYIDGIEVANPLLVAQLSPAAVDRVEVIRGPEGAALYGADALGGVIDIITRHDGGDADGQHLAIESDAGLSQSAFAAGPVLTQDHSLILRGGSDDRSGNLSVGLRRTGDYLPGAHSQQVSASAGVRLLGSRSMLLGTARLFAGDAGAPMNPLLQEVGAPAPTGAWSADRRDGRGFGDGRTDALSGSEWTPARLMDDGNQSLREYTVGGTALIAQSDRWSHSLTLGLDGYRLANVPDDNSLAPSTFDAALRRAQGGADRGTLRLASTLRLGSEPGLSSTITFALAHSTLRDATRAARPAAGAPSAWTRAGGSDAAALWESNTGLSAEASTAYHDLLYLTSGLRLERVGGLAPGEDLSALPMLGGAVVKDVGLLTAKLRASYGRGIRSPGTALRDLATPGMLRASTAGGLAPESQSGIETGVDLLAGDVFGLHATRFDQHAMMLVQPVAVGTSLDAATGAQRVLYQLQNLGAIANRGWELQSSLTLSRFTLQGALSLVDSRVLQVAPGYTGDLQAGDRMPSVPARTASVMGSWTGAHWSTSWTLSRAADWVDYDRLALARTIATTGPLPVDAFGSSLRAFWRTYPGVTHLDATFTRDLRAGLALRFAAANLLGQQRGEPDNLTVLPGRTVSVGLKAEF